MTAVVAAALSGCGTTASRDDTPPPPAEVAKTPPTTRPGGYYLDDGPGDKPPANLESIPEPTPRIEPLHRAAMRPYVVMGRSYAPMTALTPHKERGLATWYGRRYHGKPTSTGEIYDMYAMTGAHPTLPLPSYVRVTHLKTGKSIIVRLNDRGPFHEGRVIDLSYTAAHRLGILGGATMVEVESILPDRGTATAAAVPPQSPPPAPAIGAPANAPPAAEVQTTAVKPAAAPGPEFSIITPAAAEPLPPATGAPVQLPVTTDAGRVYLQLGAFGSRENAESYLARLKSQADWLALQVFPRDGLFRVQAGPFANQSDARQTADRLAQALGIKAILLTR